MNGLFTTILITAVVKFANTCDNPTTVNIPEEFLFAASTSAYQIEGGWEADGKSPSVWDTFTHNHPEMIVDHSSGDIAADSYHFYMKDIDALKSVGFNQYRFSVSWPRVIVNGTKVNNKGIDYYNRLIDGLIANGIEPAITMFHWDLPEYLHQLGGFTNPLIARYFEFYASILFESFGDRVKVWMTFNEPMSYCIRSYGEGTSGSLIHAPGVGEYLCGHHTLVTHANVYRLYRSKYYEKQHGEIGISLNLRFNYAKDDSVSKAFVESSLDLTNGWFINPIFGKDGGYPNEMVRIFEQKSKEENSWSRLPIMGEQLKKQIKGTADFLGVNYYSSRLVAPKLIADSSPQYDHDINVTFSADDRWKRAKAEWLYIVPNGLHDLLVWIRDKYSNPKVMITENGFTDNGEMNDIGRIKFIKEHLAAVLRAREEQCNVIGYTVWSLIDNFEWTDGYSTHLGIFAVNMSSVGRERSPKRSAHFLRDLIASRRLILCNEKI